jgi:hypothetical protein
VRVLDCGHVKLDALRQEEAARLQEALSCVVVVLPDAGLEAEPPDLVGHDDVDTLRQRDVLGEAFDETIRSP